MDQRYRPERTRQRQSVSDRIKTEDPSLEQLDNALQETTSVEKRRILERLLDEKQRNAAKRKWTGRGLMVFGLITMLWSCPLSFFSLVGLQTIPLAAIVVSLLSIGGGFALTTLQPKLKDTNEALLVSIKYGYRLTAARLALEMDITFDRAEKILQELVRSGIAEIDLDHKDPDNTIMYRIKGL